MKPIVFTFLGEFGYELLNWQGVIRKLRSRLPDAVPIVACSRAGMKPFYETTERYIDVSSISSYRDSTAAGYTALGSDLDVLTDDIRRYVIETSPKLDEAHFVWSNEDTWVEGLRFGGGGIYADLAIENNRFCRIDPALESRGEVEEELGWSLGEPYVLCQTARRDAIIRSTDRVPLEPVIEALGRRMRVLLLNFETGRNLDSYSSFSDRLRCSSLKASDFSRQSCLIHHARACVFFTEGDFRSHLYVPPFLGKDVHAVAPASVYQVVGYGGMSTAPVEFWNQHVFQFGGQILPWASDHICRNGSSLDEFVRRVTD